MTARVVFLGTPDFAVPSLQRLCETVDVSLVVSQPDRPAGRGQRLTPPPVAAEAARRGIPCVQPETLRDAEAVARLAAEDADLFVVAAYGQILRQAVLDLPRLGCLNVHGSLLPRWRGAAPIHRAVEAGDGVTGVAIMQMERGLDTGAVWSMEAIAIGETETSGELHDRLATLGADLLVRTLPDVLGRTRAPIPQATSRATYAHKLTAADRCVDFASSGASVAWKINAMTPWPGVRVTVGDEVITLRRAAPGPAMGAAVEPGALRVEDGRLFFACADGTSVEILELQRPGRRCLSARECLRGMEVPEGAIARPTP